MYAEIEYQGAKYSIEIPRQGYIEVLGISEHKIPVGNGGVVVEALREIVKFEPVSRSQYIVSDEERIEVILACGWKFSKSQNWRNTWELYYHEAGGRKSKWGKKMVRRWQ